MSLRATERSEVPINRGFVAEFIPHIRYAGLLAMTDARFTKFQKLCRFIGIRQLKFHRFGREELARLSSSFFG